MKKQLLTDRAFLSLSVPFQPGQEAAFEESLMQEGCREAVTTWNGVILDGHKRYRLCTEEGIEFAVQEMQFPSKEEAILWICRKRIPLYGKKTAAFRYLVGKMYEAQKQVYRENKKLPESERPLRLNETWDRVSFFVAEELHLHRATVESHGVYAAAMDQLAEKDWPLFRAILSGRVTLSFRETQEYAAMSERKLKEIGREKWGIGGTVDNAERIRVRQQKQRAEEKEEIPLSVGIKEMPAYDPDMELKGLTFTIPAWIMAMARVEKKTGQATEAAKAQLAQALNRLKGQADDLLGEMDYGREHPDGTAETLHTGCDI